jgi:DUF1707 SHOCT-like domain
MSTATKDHPSGSLRVSDADRDRAIAELSEHYQAGRLSTEELEDRTGRALQARTAADLAALFTDLPRQRQVSVTPAAAPASPGSRLPARPHVAPIAIIAIVVAVAIISGHPGLIALVPIVALIIVRRLTGATRRAPR